jgi:hypothetical protein
MKAIIEITGEIELEYDPDSKEFKETLKGFRECMDHEGTKEDVLKHVAFYVTRFGSEGMIEGVGYIGDNGVKPDKEPYSGIMVNNPVDFYFEITENKP